LQGRRNLLGIRRVCFRGYIGSKLNLRCCQDDSKPEQKENPLRGNVLSAAVKAVREEFAVEIAERPDQRREAYQLRHQVYCMERHFEPPQGGIESDGFDHRAHHAVLRRRGGGRVVGTVRVVPVSAEDPYRSLPMQRVCGAFPEHIPLDGVGEISRFSIAREVRLAAPPHLLRLVLFRGVMEITEMAGLRHWCALMEPSMLRLLRATAMYLEPHGPLVEHRGLRQPAFAEIRLLLDCLRRERPEIWDFVTDDGRLGAGGCGPQPQQFPMRKGRVLG